MIFRFGAFELDSARYELRRDGEPVPLEPKVLDVLLCLAGRSDRLVTKQELLDEVWPGVHVSESNLTRAVSMVRAALDDPAHEPRVIETVSGRGYRWKAPLEVVASGAEGAAPAQPARPSRRRPAVASAAILAALAALLALAWPRPLGWLLALSGSGIPPEAPALPAQPSVVVLPFADLSPGGGQGHLASGFAEDLTSALGRFSELFVIPRSAATRYAGGAAPTASIARELGVRYAVEGSVRVAEGRIAVSARLVEAASGIQVFADRADAALADVLEVEARLAAQIAGRLGARIGEAELERLRRRATGDFAAYELFLQGRALFYGFTRADHARARELLERAVAADPGYGLPLAYLAALELAPYMLGWDPQPERVARARALALQAQRIIPFEPIVHTVLATAALADGHPEEAAKAADVAIELGPNSDACHGVRAVAAAGEGRPLEAIRELDRALRLNPRHPDLYWMLAGYLHERTGRPELAARLFERIREANPDMVPPRLALLIQYVERGELERARALAEEVRSISPALTAELALRVYGPGWGDPASAERAREAFRAAGLP